MISWTWWSWRSVPTLRFHDIQDLLKQGIFWLTGSRIRSPANICQAPISWTLLGRNCWVWIPLFCFSKPLLWIWNFLIWGHFFYFQHIKLKDRIARAPLAYKFCCFLVQPLPCCACIVPEFSKASRVSDFYERLTSSASLLFNPSWNAYMSYKHRGETCLWEKVAGICW